MESIEIVTRHIITQVTVGPARDEPTSWLVEAIGFDGEIYWSLFGGHRAKERAIEYARVKFEFDPDSNPAHHWNNE